jgi:ribosomal protein L23
MNLQRAKLFGFQRYQTQYKFYDPKNTLYLSSRLKGYFEAPKFSKNRSLNHLTDQYKQRVEYEKYMNPKGLKYTITSNFPKVSSEIELANPKIYLVRSEKKYPANFAKFSVPMNYSKIEIKQFIQKMYNVKIKSIHISILPGNIRHDPKLKGFKRTRDVKRAAVEFYSLVDLKYRKINLDSKISLEDFAEENKIFAKEQEQEEKNEKENKNKEYVYWETNKKISDYKKQEYLKKLEERKLIKGKENGKKNQKKSINEKTKEKINI